MGLVRIIGVGNVLAGDDGAGALVARRLKTRLAAKPRPCPIEVLEAELAGPDILELIEGAEIALLVDAARSGSPPGTLHRFDLSEGPFGQSMFPHSTHALNVVDALELGRTLGLLPPRVVVYGIEAGSVQAGEALSGEVAEVLDEVVERVLGEAEACLHY